MAFSFKVQIGRRQAQPQEEVDEPFEIIETPAAEESHPNHPHGGHSHDGHAHFHRSREGRVLSHKLSACLGHGSEGLSAPHMNMHPQDQSRLFSLPAEIRLYIYELALAVDGGIAELGRPPSKHHLAMLRTCQRVRNESKDIYYDLHRFIVRTADTVRNAPHRQRDLIHAITISTSSGVQALEMVQKAATLPNLRSIHFKRDISLRYLNISLWSLMARQIQTALAELKSLEKIEFFTADASTALEGNELVRLEKLRKVDSMLKVSVRKNTVDGLTEE
ncbi:uncharacterized protein LTR77_005877 [Saxophila tyrrhenica]|uniref:Uncharacterized protein n=1 Tax=Saxophila tyrrhenica TaxID=1690608 RepID=A0AAV9PD61_9PEZI|nr:hypothetical protein LTR77_005877 [Saxophila tyrrhenica]